MGQQVHGGFGQDERRDAIGIRCRQVKGDHAAAAPAHHGRRGSAEGAEQLGRITGMVCELSARR